MQYLEYSNSESVISFDQYSMILKRRRLPALVVFILIFASTTLILLSKKPNYVSEGKLLIKNPSTISSLTGAGEGIGELQPLDNSKSSPLETEKEMLLSRSLIDKTITTLDLKDQEKKELLTIEQFLKNVSVSQVIKADILKVSYRDIEPEQAAAVVNTLMNFYLENNIATNRAEAKSAREFLEQQLPQAQVRVNQAETDLYNFKDKNGLTTSIEQQKNLAAGIIADLDQKIIQIRSEYTDINNHIGSLRNNLDANLKEAVSVDSLNQFFINSRSPEEDALLAQLEQLESELAIQRSRFTPTNPMLNTLETQVEAIKKQLLGKLEAKSKNLAHQIATLSQEKSVYKQKLMLFPSLEQQQQRLENQLQTAQSSYSKLQNNLEAVKLAENQTVANAHIISLAPVPEKPFSVRKSLVVLQGLLLGSLASIASILFLETKDKSLKNVDEAKVRLGLPVLGVIPWMHESLQASLNLQDSNRAIVVRDVSLVPVNQSYWILQTNLQFLQSNNGIKVIVVTSSIPQEGKSTVIFNLSQSMAKKGQKVLMVDADLRLDKGHLASNLSNEVVGFCFNEIGLSDVLNLKINYQKAIKQVTENIDILTSGFGTPDIVDYLDSSAMPLLLEKVSADYDFVIIDTPPLVTNSEALVMGQMADGIVLVVRPGLVDAFAINIAKERLEQSGQNVLGMVVNGVIRDNEPHQYYC